MENEGFKPCHLGDIPDNELQKFLTQMDAVEYKKESLGSLFYTQQHKKWNIQILKLNFSCFL